MVSGHVGSRTSREWVREAEEHLRKSAGAGPAAWREIAKAGVSGLLALAVAVREHADRAR